MSAAETHMDLDRITRPLRLAKGSHQPGSGKGIIGKVLVGAVGAVIAIGLAAPAGASRPRSSTSNTFPSSSPSASAPTACASERRPRRRPFASTRR